MPEHVIVVTFVCVGFESVKKTTVGGRPAIAVAGLARLGDIDEALSR